MAKKWVTNHVSKNHPSQIMEDATKEYDFGWVFFYQSVQYLKTKEFFGGLVGNAPLIVDRDNGTLHVTGTIESPEFYVEKYRRERSQT